MTGLDFHADRHDETELALFVFNADRHAETELVLFVFNGDRRLRQAYACRIDQSALLVMISMKSVRTRRIKAN